MPIDARRRDRMLTVELQDALVSHLASGAFQDEAAKACGVGKSTFYDWMRKGRDAQDKEAGGRDLNPTELLYLGFVTAVEQARGRATVYAHATIRSAMTKHWQAAAWYLERTNPARYGRWMRTADEVPTTAELEDEPSAVGGDDDANLDAVVTFAQRWAEDHGRGSKAS